MPLFADSNSVSPECLTDNIDALDIETKKALYKKLADRYHISDAKLRPPLVDDEDKTVPKDRWYYIDNHTTEAISWLAAVLYEKIDTLTIDETKALLTFCLFDGVGYDEGHWLCDHVLCGLVKGLMKDNQESRDILYMWNSIGKWYA